MQRQKKRGGFSFKSVESVESYCSQVQTGAKARRFSTATTVIFLDRVDGILLVGKDKDKDSVTGAALVRISSPHSLPLIAVAHTEQHTVDDHIKFIQRLKRRKHEDLMDLDKFHNHTAELFRGEAIGNFLELDIWCRYMVRPG